jgi:hypothetical protein
MKTVSRWPIADLPDVYCLLAKQSGKQKNIVVSQSFHNMCVVASLIIINEATNGPFKL